MAVGLTGADVISIHIPLTLTTWLLIGVKEFALMKIIKRLDLYVLGGVVDEKAMIEVLENRAIRACGLDVIEIEPPEPSNAAHQDPAHAVTYTQVSSVDCTVDASSTVVGFVPWSKQTQHIFGLLLHIAFDLQFVRFIIAVRWLR